MADLTALEQFCATCKGDGSLPIYGEKDGKRMRIGVRVCPACDGRCVVQAPVTSKTESLRRYSIQRHEIVGGYTAAGTVDVYLASEVDAVLAQNAVETTEEPEFESVGWQYKFASIWGGHVWRDSPSRHNGSDYTESREIFARRAVKSEARRCSECDDTGTVVDTEGREYDCYACPKGLPDRILKEPQR